MRAKPALQLVVEGTITAKGTTTPRTRLGPNAAPDEATFDLDIARAWLSDGTEQAAGLLWPTTFAGDLALGERFAVGDVVTITCTTATGRFIGTMARAGGTDEAE